jgi:hypothetical protein
VACMKTVNDIVTQPSALSARQAVSRAAQAPAAHQSAPQQIAAVQQQARTAMDQAERKAATASTPAAASEAVKDAEHAVDVARRMRGPAKERASLLREVERKLDSVKRTAGKSPAPARPDSIDYGRLAGASSTIDDALYGPALEHAWTNAYITATAGEREILSFTVGTFTWVWDATAEEGRTENRLIGVYGRSDPQGLPRDKNRIAGFPSPQRHHAAPVHRGHAAGHQLGGPDEGWNFIPQMGSVNLGGRWKNLEKYCADNPGTFMFVHAVYSNDTDEPSGLEYGVMRQDGQLVIEEFDNL